MATRTEGRPGFWPLAEVEDIRLRLRALPLACPLPLALLRLRVLGLKVSQSPGGLHDFTVSNRSPNTTGLLSSDESSKWGPMSALEPKKRPDMSWPPGKVYRSL